MSSGKTLKQLQAEQRRMIAEASELQQSSSPPPTIPSPSRRIVVDTLTPKRPSQPPPTWGERGESGRGDEVSPGPCAGVVAAQENAGKNNMSREERKQEREKSLMTQRFEKVHTTAPFQERGSRAIAAPTVAAADDDNETTSIAKAPITVAVAPPASSNEFHTSQHGPLNAELRGHWEKLVSSWNGEVVNLLDKIDTLTTKCTSIQTTSHHAARHYEENYELPMESTVLKEADLAQQKKDEETAVERFLKEAKQKQRAADKIAAKAAAGRSPSTNSLGSVDSISLGEDAAGKGDDEEGAGAEEKTQSVLLMEKICKAAGLRLTPNVIGEILDAPFIELQVVASSMHELQHAETKMPSVRMEQRLEDLQSVDAAARQPVAGLLLALHEKYFFDVFGPTKTSLERGLPEVTRLMHNADLLKEDRNAAIASGNLKSVEDLLEGEVHLRRQLIHLLCSRMDQLVDCSSDSAEYKTGRTKLLDLGDRVAADFVKGSETFTEDISFDIQALTNHRKELRNQSEEQANSHMLSQAKAHERIQELELEEHSAWAALMKAAENVKRIVQERHRAMGDLMAAEEKFALSRQESKDSDTMIDRHLKSLLEAKGCLERTSATAEKVATTEGILASKLKARDIDKELLELSRKEAKRFRASYKEFASSSETLLEKRQTKFDSIQRQIRQLQFDREIAIDCLDPKAAKYATAIEGQKEQATEAEGILQDTEEVIKECHDVSSHVLDFMCDLQQKAESLRSQRLEEKRKRKRGGAEEVGSPNEKKQQGGGTLVGDVAEEEKDANNDGKKEPADALGAADNGEDDDVDESPPDTPVDDPLLIERAGKIQERDTKNKKVTSFFLQEGEAAELVFTEIRRQKSVAAQQQREDTIHQEGLLAAKSQKQQQKPQPHAEDEY